MNRISDILGGKTKVNLSDIPGYEAGLGAGETAIRREAAAQGTRGGRTLASLFGFGQQYAGKAFSDYMGQLGGMANMGLQAETGVLNAQQQAAQAQAASKLGQTQAFTNLGMAGLSFVGSGGFSKLSGGISNLFHNSNAGAMGTPDLYSWGG